MKNGYISVRNWYAMGDLVCFSAHVGGC